MPSLCLKLNCRLWQVIIAGDFNSLPGSAVHELLTTGALRPEAAEVTAAVREADTRAAFVAEGS